MLFAIPYASFGRINALFSQTTVKLQWLEYLSKHENMFETGAVPAYEC